MGLGCGEEDDGQVAELPGRGNGQVSNGHGGDGQDGNGQGSNGWDGNRQGVNGQGIIGH